MSSMLDKLLQYQTVLLNQSQKQKQALQAIQQKYIQQFKKQLQNSLQNHWKRYRKVRKNLEKQIAAVQYYVKLGQQQRQNIDLEKKSEEWRSLLENTNLYALFKDIDDQIAWNFGVLEDFTFFCSFPLKQENHYQQTLTQIQILKNQQKQYSQLISTILKKYPPQKNLASVHEAYTAIHQKYKTLPSLTSPCASSTNKQLKLKDNLPFIISTLISNKYLCQIEISIIAETGIMKQEQYRELADALLMHRFYLKSLIVRVMDMEFCQEKCDLVRRCVRNFKSLEKFVIFNYYQECKLGMFVDFNWAPYRKNINVKASVWK